MRSKCPKAKHYNVSETGFTDKIDFIVVQIPLSNNRLSTNSRIRFQGDVGQLYMKKYAQSFCADFLLHSILLLIHCC
jgi:hypothetical protein